MQTCHLYSPGSLCCKLFVPGNWLIASDSRSRLCIFSMDKALSQEASSSSYRPLTAVIQLEEPVYALQTIDSTLICGDADGQIFGYSWDEIIEFATAEKQNSLNLPKTSFSVSGYPSELSAPPPNEINALVAIDDGKILYAGAGDYAVRLVPAEQPDKICFTFLLSFDDCQSNKSLWF